MGDRSAQRRLERGYRAEVTLSLFEAEEVFSPVILGVAGENRFLSVHLTTVRSALYYVKKWHSVLPECSAFLANNTCFLAISKETGEVICVAVWSDPATRALNGRGYYELRRMATSPDAPKNTCSAILAIMRRHIAVTLPQVTCFLSYQDKDKHTGGIYKADNWTIGWESTRSAYKGSWDSREGRSELQSSAVKIAWVKPVLRQTKARAS